MLVARAARTHGANVGGCAKGLGPWPIWVSATCAKTGTHSRIGGTGSGFRSPCGRRRGRQRSWGRQGV